MILAQNWPKTAKSSWHCSFKLGWEANKAFLFCIRWRWETKKNLLLKRPCHIFISQCVINSFVSLVILYVCWAWVQNFLFSPHYILKGCIMPSEPDYWCSGYHPLGGFFCFSVPCPFALCFLIYLSLCVAPRDDCLLFLYISLSSVCTHRLVLSSQFPFIECLGVYHTRSFWVLDEICFGLFIELESWRFGLSWVMAFV